MWRGYENFEEQAIKLIDEKIGQFKDILENATYENRYDESYDLVYYGTEELLTDLFSRSTAETFSKNVSGVGIISLGEPINYAQKSEDYKDHIKKCITTYKFTEKKYKIVGKRKYLLKARGKGHAFRFYEFQ